MFRLLTLFRNLTRMIKLEISRKRKPIHPMKNNIFYNQSQQAFYNCLGEIVKKICIHPVANRRGLLHRVIFSTLKFDLNKLQMSKM